MDVDASYHCWVQFYAPNLDWLTLDVAVADIYVSGVEVNEKNAKLMELTTATGYKGADPKMVDYYFGNLGPTKKFLSYFIRSRRRRIA